MPVPGHENRDLSRHQRRFGQSTVTVTPPAKGPPCLLTYLFACLLACLVCLPPTATDSPLLEMQSLAVRAGQVNQGLSIPGRQLRTSSWPCLQHPCAEWWVWGRMQRCMGGGFSLTE